MKKITLYSVSSLLLAVFALLSVSCGATAKVREAAERQKKMNDLRQISLLYMNYCDTNPGKGPANADDLAKLTMFPEDKAAVDKAKSGQYVVIYGVNLNDFKVFEPQGRSNTIIAYEASAPTSGGAVVMADGAAQYLSASEFNSKTKAKSGSMKK